jgi:hypothetical protein
LGAKADGPTAMPAPPRSLCATPRSPTRGLEPVVYLAPLPVISAVAVVSSSRRVTWNNMTVFNRLQDGKALDRG